MTSDNDDMHRPRGRPMLPPAEPVRRERERDRIKKRRMRARLVERYLQLTPVRAFGEDGVGLARRALRRDLFGDRPAERATFACGRQAHASA